MRILITGSEGGISRYAVSRLRTEGHQLRTLDVVDTMHSGNEDQPMGGLRDLVLLRRAITHARGYPA